MEYKSFYLIDDGENNGLFSLKVGGAKSNLINDERSNRKINIVSNKTSKNGIEGFIFNDNLGVKNCITVATRGNDYFSCYQEDYTVTIVGALLLDAKKFELNKYSAFYICALLKMNAYKCNYGRVLSGERLKLEKILLPIDGSGDPFWEYIEQITAKYYRSLHKMVSKKSAIQNESTSLDCKEWKNFRLGDLFLVEKCKCNNASKLLEDGEDALYIGAKKSNNGFVRKVKSNLSLTSKGNGVIFIGNGEGSIGYSLYQERDFIGLSDSSVGYHPKLNKYNALFLVTILDLERYRYSFGRKYGKNVIENAVIKMPAKMGKGNEYEPDWQFMEDYIKSLPYSSNLASNRSNS